MKTASKASGGFSTLLKLVMAMAFVLASVSVYGSHFSGDLFYDHFDEKMPGQSLTNGDIARLVAYGSLAELREFLDSQKDNPDKINPTALLSQFPICSEFGGGGIVPEKVKLLFSYGADPNTKTFRIGRTFGYSLPEKIESRISTQHHNMRTFPEDGDDDRHHACINEYKEVMSVVANADQYMNTALTGGSTGSGGSSTSGNATSPRVKKSGEYGAVAKEVIQDDGDTDTSSVIAVGNNSLEEAKADALERCNDLFDKCEIAISFRNNCGAVAITSEGDFYATSGSTRDALEKKVVEVCNRRADPRICALSNIACATE